MSPSPSPGYQLYSRGNYAVLPTDDTDLTTIYSAGDITDVATSNDIRVSQSASSQYAVHLFKDYIGAEDNINIQWEGQTNLDPASSTVYLQIYNRNTTTWETIDSDNTSSIDIDFILTADVLGLTNYKDGNTVISWRVYQLSI